MTDCHRILHQPRALFLVRLVACTLSARQPASALQHWLLSYERSQCHDCLTGEHPIAQRSDLLVGCHLVERVGNPSLREAHQPLDKLRGRPRAGGVVHERGCWCRSPDDVFPDSDGGCVVSPPLKMSSIRDHSVSGSRCLSGEPGGPFSARSMI